MIKSIHIIFTQHGVPFAAYWHETDAIAERKRLNELDDYIEYSLISLPIQDMKIKIKIKDLKFD